MVVQKCHHWETPLGRRQAGLRKVSKVRELFNGLHSEGCRQKVHCQGRSWKRVVPNNSAKPLRRP